MMRGTHPVCSSFLLLAALTLAPGEVAALVADRIQELRSKFTAESDPVRKAKALVKLSEEQFKLLRARADAGDYEAALAVVEQYREDVRNSFTALKATGRDPEKHSNGFRQLEINLRKNIALLDQTIRTIPPDLRVFFQSVQQDLEEVNRQLLDVLFPRRPGKRPGGGKP